MLQRGLQVVERLAGLLVLQEFLKVGASDKLVQQTRQDEDLVLAQLSPRHTDGAYGRMSFHGMCGLSGVSLWVQTVARSGRRSSGAPAATSLGPGGMLFVSRLAR